MYSIRLTRLGLMLSLVVLSLCLATVSASAETFVSYNGRFHFTYPDTWTQLDYTTAQFYLSRGDTAQKVEFEAVFCEKNAMVLFEDQYLILTVDTVGNLAPHQIDSVIGSLSTEFKRPIKEVTSDVFLRSYCKDSVVFDRAGKRASVESEVPGDSSGTKINLLVMTFYEQGIANFYFYSPTFKYAANLPLYREMIMSVSTEPLPNATTAEPVKVADIEKKPEGSLNYPLIFGTPLFIILLVLIVRLRKKRQQANSSNTQKG